jgi:hypothetical protein
MPKPRFADVIDSATEYTHKLEEQGFRPFGLYASYNKEVAGQEREKLWELAASTPLTWEEVVERLGEPVHESFGKSAIRDRLNYLFATEHPDLFIWIAWDAKVVEPPQYERA